MTDEALKYLSDIQKAIGLIEDFSSDTLLFEDYVKDLKTQSAVERQLGIVGEALKKFDSNPTRGYNSEFGPIRC